MARGLVVLALASLAGCSPGLPASAMPRPIGEDLAALLPSGAELVIDVDVQQLRTWYEIDRVLGLLPPAGRERLARIGPHWMNDLDAIVVAAARVDGQTRSTMVMRCDLDDAGLARLLDGEARRGELGGRLLFETTEEAVLRLGGRLVALGTPVEVRRVLDVMRGDAESFRVAKADRALREALGRAPSARSGRPAVLAAATAGPLMSDRFDAAGLGGRGPGAASFALAVGDGLDAVLVLLLGSPPEALALQKELDRALRDLKQRPFVRLLGLDGALDLASVVRERELRIAYRLSGQRLGGFLDRLERAKKMAEGGAPGAR